LSSSTDPEDCVLPPDGVFFFVWGFFFFFFSSPPGIRQAVCPSFLSKFFFSVASLLLGAFFFLLQALSFLLFPFLAEVWDGLVTVQ